MTPIYPPADVVNLLKLSFPRNHYIESFPTAFANPSHWVRLHTPDVLLGFCALQPMVWKTPKGNIRGICIGSVCTHPDHRGQGLGLSLMEAAVQRATDLGGDFAFLFSDLDSFYKKAGFAPAGTDALAPLQLSAPSHTSARKNADTLLSLKRSQRMPVALRLKKSAPAAMTHGAVERMWEFFSRHSAPQESQISLSEFRTLLTIPTMDLFTLEGDELQAACFLGKGADFHDTLHGSTATSDALLIDLLGRIVETHRRRPLLLLLPLAHPSLRETLATLINPLYYWRPLSGSSWLPADLATTIAKMGLYPRSLQSI